MPVIMRAGGCCNCFADSGLCACSWLDAVLCITLSGFPTSPCCDINHSYTTQGGKIFNNVTTGGEDFLNNTWIGTACAGGGGCYVTDPPGSGPAPSDPQGRSGVRVACGTIFGSPSTNAAVDLNYYSSGGSLTHTLITSGGTITAGDCEGGTVTKSVTWLLTTVGGGTTTGTGTISITPGPCGMGATGAGRDADEPAEPCRFRGKQALTLDVVRLGLNGLQDWYRCDNTRNPRRPADKLVTDCLSCGIEEARQCRPTCPGYFPDDE